LEILLDPAAKLAMKSVARAKLQLVGCRRSSYWAAASAASVFWFHCHN
jgi:hypothetical protein